MIFEFPQLWYIKKKAQRVNYITKCEFYTVIQRQKNRNDTEDIQSLFLENCRIVGTRKDHPTTWDSVHRLQYQSQRPFGQVKGNTENHQLHMQAKRLTNQVLLTQPPFSFSFKITQRDCPVPKEGQRMQFKVLPMYKKQGQLEGESAVSCDQESWSNLLKMRVNKGLIYFV